jgi:hypothetical protein
MSLTTFIAQLGAAGSGNPYWVGTYSSSGATTENYVGSVYSDDFDLLVFSQLVSGQYEYFIVNGVTGDFIRAERQYDSSVINYAEPSDIHLTKTSTGEVWVGTKDSGDITRTLEFIRLGASGVIDRYALQSPSTNCMFGLVDKDKNFYIFGDDGNGASFAPTINTTLERGLFSSFTQGQMNSAAYDATANKLYCLFSQNSNGPILFRLDVASNADLTNPSGVRLSHFTTGQNPALKVRLGPSGSMYYAFYYGSNLWNVAQVSTTPPFNKISGTNVVTNFAVTNPASASTSSNQYARLHYDPVNDCVYLARDFAICCLSSNLSTVNWLIETNLSAMSAINTASGDVIISGAHYTNNINVVARIDANATQVSSTLTSPISGFSWKRSSTSITTSTTYTNTSTSIIMSTSSTGGIKAFSVTPIADARGYTDSISKL